MKKIVFFSIVLFLLVAPAWGGDPVIYLEQVGETNEVLVKYDANGAGLIRAFGLDVNSDTGATIGDANWLKYEPNYQIYPGQIDINDTTGLVDDYGTPICDPFGLPAGTTLPGLDSNGVSVEMGSLYVGTPNAPPSSGTLLSLFINSASDCNVSIEGNAARTGTGSDPPGLVMEDPDQHPTVHFKGIRWKKKVTEELDFGDANDPPYPTLLPNGACHLAVGVILGALRDTEGNGQPNPSATGDDIAVSDDEDGITALTANQVSGSVTVTVLNGPGRLSAWIDFNNDGDWADAGEQIFNNVLVNNGPQVLAFAVPVGPKTGIPLISRWRIVNEPESVTTYTGLANSGEVEDYNQPTVKCTCRGDWTGDNIVAMNADLLPFLGKLNAAKALKGVASYTQADTITWPALAPWKPCADWNGNGTCDMNGDLLPLLGKLNLAKVKYGVAQYNCHDPLVDP